MRQDRFLLSLVLMLILGGAGSAGYAQWQKSTQSPDQTASSSSAQRSAQAEDETSGKAAPTEAPAPVAHVAPTSAPDAGAQAIVTVRKMYGRSMREVITAFIETSGSVNHETGWTAKPSGGGAGIWKVNFPWGNGNVFNFEYDAKTHLVSYIGFFPLDCDGCVAASPDPLQP